MIAGEKMRRKNINVLLACNNIFVNISSFFGLHLGYSDTRGILGQLFGYCIIEYKPIVICFLAEIVNRIKYHRQMKAFNNRPAYFRIIISSEIRNYIFKYIVLHLPSKCEGIHCSCYHFFSD